eukprot:NODE_61_length_25240_cov_0.547194.p10 type:complete len:318 gc:universal NODE_61_length_25240_cov_0.547194:5394-4441(-)
MESFQNKLEKYQFLGKTDISDFYKSVYTHAIPWLIWGRQLSKESVDQKLWPNKLEACFRSCIFKENVSLPIGQEIFSDLAEFILLCLETKIKAKLSESNLCNSMEIIRIDDAFYYFGNESSKIHGAFMKTMQAVGEFKFSLNSSKTGIVEIPNPKPQLTNLKVLNNVTVAHMLLKERGSLSHLFLLDAHFFKWIFTQSDLLIDSSLEEYGFFQSMIQYPGCHICMFKRMMDPTFDQESLKTIIKQWIVQCPYLYEYIASVQLIWVLWIIYKHKLPVNKVWLSNLSELNHSLVDLLVMAINSNDEKVIGNGWFQMTLE